MGDVIRLDGKDYADILKSAKKRIEAWEASPENLPHEVVMIEIGNDGQLSIYGWGEKSDSYSAIVHMELAALSMKTGMLYGGGEED